MADFNSKYSGEQVEELLDQVASGNAGGGGGGGIILETDPVFSASPAASITEEKIAEWDAKSAQGEKGDKGDTGPQGEQGPKGEDGADGVGVQSVAQTTTSNVDGGSNVVTVTLTNGTKSTFTVKNGSKGSQGIQGEQGPKGDTGATGAQGPKGDKGDKGDTGANGANGTNGKDGTDGADGATFTPSVDSAGNLSWTNNKGLTNPPTVNIKGPKGDKGDAGEGGGGSGEDIRYFTDFTVENVVLYAPAGATIPCNNVDALIEAVRASKLICIPYADVDSGYVVASYSFFDGVEHAVSANFSIFEGGSVYYFYIIWNGVTIDYLVKGSHVTTLSAHIKDIDVEDGVALVYARDNSVYIIGDIVEELYVYPEEYLDVGTTIKLISGENLTIEIIDCLWANGVVPTIEPNTHYELSISQNIEGGYNTVLTPFKYV